MQACRSGLNSRHGLSRVWDQLMFPPANNRITKYERIVLASIVAVATIVTAVVIVADQFKVNLLADLMRDRSDLPSTCNAKLGARFLFWAAFAYEIASIPVALHLKRRTWWRIRSWEHLANTNTGADRSDSKQRRRSSSLPPLHTGDHFISHTAIPRSVILNIWC